MLRSWPVAGLGSYFTAVVLLACAPLTVLMAWHAAQDLRAREELLLRSVQASTRALASLIEAELVASADMLDTLAASGAAPEAGGTDGSPVDARLRRSSWYSLFVEEPVEAGRTGDVPAATGRRAIAVAAGPDGEPAVRVSVDADRGRRLGAWIKLRHWQALMAAAAPSHGLTGRFVAIHDANDRLIAGSQGFVAQPALNTGPVPVSGGQLAAARVDTADGSKAYAAWQKLGFGGWTVALGVPAAPFDRAAQETMLATLAVAAACLLVGVMLAGVVARRTVVPLAALVRGEVGAAGSPIREIAALQSAIADGRAADRIAASQLQRRSEVLEASFENAPVAMALCLDTACATWSHNRAMRELLGSPRTAWPQILREGRPVEATERALFAAARHGLSTPSHEQEWRLGPALGTRRVLVQAEPLLDAADGRPYGGVEVVIDITALKSRLSGAVGALEEPGAASSGLARAAADGQRARPAAGDAGRENDLLAMLGHELRSPLNALSAASAVLRSLIDAGDALAVEALEVVARQTHQLTLLTNEFLFMSRLADRPTTLKLTPIDLHAMAAAMVEELRPLAGCRRVDLHGASGWILADAEHLDRMLHKLFEHAVLRAGAVGTVTLQVRPEGRDVVLRLGWNVLGTVPETGEQVPLVRAEPARLPDAQPHGGMTLGLAWATALAALHGARLEWRFTPAGAEAVVRFEGLPSQVLESVPLLQERAAPLPRTLLLVENDVSTRQALGTALELEGHRVTHAADGAEGLAVLLAERPEVAIVDITMPGLGGLALARQARGAGYSGRLIALSEPRADDMHARALHAGFDDYLAKPPDIARLNGLLAAPA